MSTFSALFLPEKIHFVHPAKNRTPLYVSNAQKASLISKLFSTAESPIFTAFFPRWEARLSLRKPSFQHFFSPCFPSIFRPFFRAFSRPLFTPSSGTFRHRFSPLFQTFFAGFTPLFPPVSLLFFATISACFSPLFNTLFPPLPPPVRRPFSALFSAFFIAVFLPLLPPKSALFCPYFTQKQPVFPPFSH